MTTTLLGPLAAFISSVTWAVGSTGYSGLSRRHSAFSIGFCRALIALPIFVVTALIAAGGVTAFEHVSLRHFSWLGISMAASYGLGDTFFLWSTLSLGIPAALALASCYPIWTAVFGLVFRHELMSPLQFGGLLVTVAGMAIVILNKPRHPKDPPRSAGAIAGVSKKGVFLALAASVCWAVNGYAVAQGGQDLSPLVANSIRMAFALGIVVIVRRCFRSRVPNQGPLLLPGAEIRQYFWLFILESYAGSLTFVYGLSHSSLAIGATLSSLAPVLSVPVAWIAGLERFSPLRTLGICLVVTGLCLLIGFGIG